MQWKGRCNFLTPHSECNWTGAAFSGDEGEAEIGIDCNADKFVTNLNLCKLWLQIFDEDEEMNPAAIEDHITNRHALYVLPNSLWFLRCRQLSMA